MANIKLSNDVKILQDSLDLGTLLNGKSQKWADVSSPSVNSWVTNFGNVDSSGKVIGYNMGVNKGTYLVIGKYDVTGANADAGIRLYVDEQSYEEVFGYRGANTGWKHSIIVMSVVTLETNGTMRLGYYLNSNGSITNPRLTAIPINSYVG